MGEQACDGLATWWNFSSLTRVLMSCVQGPGQGFASAVGARSCARPLISLPICKGEE